MERRTLRTAPLEENLEGTLETLGGEDTLKRKYPELYKAVLNTREKLKSAPLRASEEGGEYIFGSENSCKIRTLNYTPDTTLSTVSDMVMETVKPSLAIISDISDGDSGRSIDGFAVSASYSDTLSGKTSIPSSELSGGTAKRFIAKSSFIVIEKDADGKNIIKTLDSVMDSQKTMNNETIVKNLVVNAPMPIRHQAADHTAVFYNRSGANSDYEFTNVKYGDDSVDVFMPFSGSVELNGIYAPNPNNPVIKDGEKGLILQIENVRNGCANFDMKYWNDIKWNVTGSVLTWEFPTNWHNILKKNKLTCANNMNFYCKMYINTTLGIPVPIVIQSNGEEHGDASYKRIPHINIMWGCFAKDVLIRMADGMAKPIQHIRVGDMVMTKDSGMCRVMYVVSGREEKLVHIRTSSMNRIDVSGDHPMLTTSGMVNADKLTAGTVLITENGEESIESLYLMDYADMVYNLALERNGILIANNFYTGDFEAQNALTASCRRVMSAPSKLEEFQEELADLVSTINQNKKNSL